MGIFCRIFPSYCNIYRIFNFSDTLTPTSSDKRSKWDVHKPQAIIVHMEKKFLQLFTLFRIMISLYHHTKYSFTQSRLYLDRRDGVHKMCKFVCTCSSIRWWIASPFVGDNNFYLTLSSSLSAFSMLHLRFYFKF